MDERPIIGICAGLTEASWGVWEQRAVLLPYAYITAVQRFGGIVLMIPPDPELEEEPDRVLDLLDGLILAGGSDIDPSYYGAERHPQTKETVLERDSIELALARRAWERDLPVLGVCRGMQLINVARGGTLIQHLPDEVGHGEHRRVPGSFDGSEHDVHLTDGSLAARAAGETVHVTKSHHHQGIDELGDGLEITGVSALDDLPEAFEARDRKFVLGVQWHPEADGDSRVIEALVQEAHEYHQARPARYLSTRGSP